MFRALYDFLDDLQYILPERLYDTVTVIMILSPFLVIEWIFF